MPSIICAKCNSETNTACSNHLFPIRPDGKANECYAKLENGKWIKGCSYDEAHDCIKKVILNMIKEPENE